jgi:hypothetical protein
LHLRTLLVCPYSVYDPDYSFYIFKLFFHVLLRCMAPDYYFCIFNLLLYVLLQFYLQALLVPPSSVYGP